jgi:hypothetical protein
VAGQLVHHTNLSEADADRGKLVCYDCGVACDLTAMRGERLAFLRQLGADAPRERGELVRRQSKLGGHGKARPKPQVAFAERPTRKFRVSYAKTGRAAFLGHLDTMRVLGACSAAPPSRWRTRAASIPSRPSPSPRRCRSGWPSLGEIFDVAVEAWTGDADALCERLREVSPEGLEMTGARELTGVERSLAKLIRAYDLLIRPAEPAAEGALAERASSSCRRRRSRSRAATARIDVRGFVESVDVLGGDAAARLCAALDWEGVGALVRARVTVAADGSAKPIEVARALGLAGEGAAAGPRCRLARLGFVGPEMGGEVSASRPATSQPPDSRAVMLARVLLLAGPRMLRAARLVVVAAILLSGGGRPPRWSSGSTPLPAARPRQAAATSAAPCDR